MSTVDVLRPVDVPFRTYENVEYDVSTTTTLRPAPVSLPTPTTDAPTIDPTSLASTFSDPEVSREKVEELLKEEANGGADSQAFFVANLASVASQHSRWIHALPHITPFYAVKCNPDAKVLRLLASLGAGFDCASPAEIDAVLSVGVEPDRIIYANPCKAASAIRGAKNRGVRTMTFDNADELGKIRRVYGKDARLVLRILADDSSAACRLGVKFGAPEEDVEPLLAKARELGLSVVGISFHVGSGCADVCAFDDAVCRAKKAALHMREYGVELEVLDVGGGFDGGASCQFEDAARVLRDAISREFAGCPGFAGVKVIGEPGRFYVASAFTLACCVIARRGGDVPMYYINEGVYGAFNCILFDHQTPSPRLLCEKNGEKRKGSIWGPTCDGLDCVCAEVDIKVLDVGDFLVFEGMGAYTICAASRFNGFESARVVYTWDG